MRTSRRPASPFAAGLIGVVLMAIALWFAFSGSNPFSSPFTLNAAFSNGSNLKPGSPVRIAGVDVGKVTKVEPLEDSIGARVEMEIQDRGLPIHSDATLKIRSRIFLEGNVFVDLRPGSPTAPALEDDDDAIPSTQTASPVQLGEVLTVLQSDVRSDLQTFLDEYSTGISGEGARGFRESVQYWENAYRTTALANEAFLGQEPDRDIQRVLQGQRRTFAALVRNEEALKGLVTNFAGTAGAFARESEALEATVPELRDTLAAAQPALDLVNGALPSLRRFAVEALPGVRTSAPVLEAGTPFLEQAAGLMGRDELRGTARELRAQVSRLVDLNQATVETLEQARALSACTNRVLVPFANSPIPNPDEPENSDQPAHRQIQRGFVGLAGESRLNDANQSWFRAMAVPPGELIPGAGGVRPAPPSDRGNQPPPRRPDVPCETQEAPNLNAPGGPLAEFAAPGQQVQTQRLAPASERREAIEQIPRLLRSWELDTRRQQRAAEREEQER